MVVVVVDAPKCRRDCWNASRRDAAARSGAWRPTMAWSVCPLDLPGSAPELCDRKSSQDAAVSMWESD